MRGAFKERCIQNYYDLVKYTDGEKNKHLWAGLRILRSFALLSHYNQVPSRTVRLSSVGVWLIVDTHHTGKRRGYHG